MSFDIPPLSNSLRGLPTKTNLTMSPLVCIVILSWNSRDDILECLRSLQGLDYPNYRIVLVDNGSTDDTVTTVRAQFPHVQIIENGQNFGYAEGNNVGIRYALENNADYIFILNDDTVVAPDAVSLLVETGEQNPTIGMLGASVVSYFNRSKEFLGARIDWCHGMTYQIPYSITGMGDADHVAGCALMIKSQVARQIGLLDPAYFCYFEETDWGVRCQKAGYRVVTVFQSKVYHKGTPDNIRHISPNLLFYYRRNQYYFMSKHAPRSLWCLFQLDYALQCLSQTTSLIRLADLENAQAVLDGFWAGLTHQYGAKRVTAPWWFKVPLVYVLGVLGKLRYQIKMCFSRGVVHNR